MSGVTQRRTAVAAATATTVPAARSDAAAARSSSSHVNTSLFSANPSKRRGEIFFLAWGPVWIAMMAFIVATRWFEDFTGMHYMVTGLLICVPPIVLPLLFPGSDASIPWTRRYTTKANVWIFILSWVANYMWTHYFYNVLGATYTFAAWRLNDVPFALFLITHSYFHFYHVLSSMALRWAWRKGFNNRVSVVSVVLIGVLICLLSFVVAFMETFTIQNFPYYYIPDRMAMYVYGSMFYALYFVVSFPMFLRMDEEVGECWTLSRAFFDACAASMLITQLLDFWRLAIGPIVDIEAAHKAALLVRPKYAADMPTSRHSVPFIY